MRRPRPQVPFVLAAIAALLLASAPASAQSTARPLPAFGLDSPISTITASFPKLATVTEATAQPSRSGLIEASAPLTGGHAFTPTATAPSAEAFSSLELFALVNGTTDFKDVGGNLTAQRAGLDATIGRRTEERAFALHLRNESTFYKFGSGSTLVPGEPKPFNDLYETSAGVQLAVRADETWTWLAGLEVTLAGEELVNPTDSLILGGLAGVRYSIADDVDFTFGLAGESRLEDDAWVMPFFGFDWRLGEHTRAAIHGSELRFEQDLGKDLSLNLGASFDIRQYRLEDDGPVPGGVFRDEEIKVSAGLDWQVTESGRLGIEVGQVMWSEYTVLDGAGSLVGQSEGDPTNYLGVSLTFGI